MRVLFVIAWLGRGGMERQLIELSAGLQRRGHAVRIVVEKSVTGYHDEIASAGLDVVELGRMRRSDPRLLGELVRCARSFAPDVVVCENFNATLWGRIAASRLGVPAVTAEHSTERAVRRRVVASNRLLASRTAAIVACAEAQVESLVDEGNPKELIEVIPNGVDVWEFAPDRLAGQALRDRLGIPQGAPVIGIVAAHRAEKRHDRFIALVEAVRDSGVDAWGLAVGGGPQLEATREAAARSRAADRIVVAGPMDDMVAAYGAMSVAVLVSDSVETLPLAALEAQACEVPVLSLDIGGVRETMDVGVSGVIVGRDDIEALAAETAQLLRDPAQITRMGGNARRYVSSHLTIDVTVARYEQLLTKVAGG